MNFEVEIPSPTTHCLIRVNFPSARYAHLFNFIGINLNSHDLNYSLLEWG